MQDTDKYGRTVGRVYVGSLDVNAELVKRGAAWVYRQYSSDPSLITLEQQAKAARRGLWALPEAQRRAPWDWRHGTCGTAPAPAATTPATTTSGGFSCNGKRYCRECRATRKRSFT